MGKSIDVVLDEFATVRTGRASTKLVESVTVEYYNTPTPLQQLASFSTPDARTLEIRPYDASALADIDAASLCCCAAGTTSNSCSMAPNATPATSIV